VRRLRARLEGLATRPAVLGAIAFLTYAAAAVLIFGRGVLDAPGDEVVGDTGADKSIYMWAMEWIPHALAHGHDPFDANVVWVPDGIDLSWVTAVPLAAFALLPLTLLAGPVVTYNVAVLASPALSGWAAYLLARWLTKAFWPSLVAGSIFGFSAFELGHMLGHLHLVLACFVPLCALLVLRHLDGELSDRRFGVLLALALAGQFLVSTEVFVILLVVGAIFATSVAVADRAMLGPLLHTLRWSAFAIGGCLVLMLPYLWHAVVVAGIDNVPVRSPLYASADLANYVVPTRRIWLQLPWSSDIAGRFTANGAERGAYLGLPLLVVVALFLRGARTSRPRRAVALGLALTVVASLGAMVRIAGHDLVKGPWIVPAKLPVTRAILPVRLTLFVALVVAMIVAVWLAERTARHPGWRWALALLGIACVLPVTGRWSNEIPYPAFFAGGAEASQLQEGDNVLVLPYGGAGWSLLWQADDGFRYRLAGGHFGRSATPEERRWEDVYRTLGRGPATPATARKLRRFLAAHDIHTIVVAPGTRPQPRRLVELLGVEPVQIEDALVYRL
jgi:hypothetical protein